MVLFFWRTGGNGEYCDYRDAENRDPFAIVGLVGSASRSGRPGLSR